MIAAAVNCLVTDASSKYRIRRDGHIVFEIGKAVTFHFDDLAVADDNESEAGDLTLLHLYLDVVIDWVGLRQNKKRGGQLEKDQGENKN